MLITRISLRRTVNLGNYENFSIEMTADIDEDDHFHPSMQDLRDAMECECEFTRNDILGRRVTQITGK